MYVPPGAGTFSWASNTVYHRFNRKGNKPKKGPSRPPLDQTPGPIPILGIAPPAGNKPPTIQHKMIW